MRVHVVSDVHGNAEALARAGDNADALIVLGDLINLVDYLDHSNGLLGQLFGPEKVARYAALRSGSVKGVSSSVYFDQLWDSIDNPASLIEEALLEQYAALFAAMDSAPTYVIPGNVDNPHLWPRFARDGIYFMDSQTVELGGLRFGFVGGGERRGTHPLTGPWQSYLRTHDEFTTALRELPEIDVLGTHIPPAVAELAYDVRARYSERGSTAILEAITKRQLSMALFGHVHNPLSARRRVGWTECVNVGHFQYVATPYVLRW